MGKNATIIAYELMIMLGQVTIKNEIDDYIGLIEDYVLRNDDYIFRSMMIEGILFNSEDYSALIDDYPRSSDDY